MEQIKEIQKDIYKQDIFVKTLLKELWESKDQETFNSANCDFISAITRHKLLIDDLERKVNLFIKPSERDNMSSEMEALRYQLESNYKNHRKATTEVREMIREEERKRLFNHSAEETVLKKRPTVSKTATQRAANVTSDLYRIRSLLADQVEQSRLSYEALLRSSDNVHQIREEFHSMRDCCSQSPLESVSKVPLSTKQEMEDAIFAAKDAFKSWSQTTLISRQQYMFKFQNLVKSNMVYARRAANGKQVQSNMEAKNHEIIIPDANKEDTLNQIIGAAGQRCMALSTVIFVGESKDWIEELIPRANKLKVIAGHIEGTDIGPVISPQAKQKICSLVDSRVKEGAKLLLDGRGVQVLGFEKGNFIGTTILSDVTTSMQCYKEEIFGPVVIVLTADILDDAINIINSNPYGSETAIFTRNCSTAREFTYETDQILPKFSLDTVII